MIRIILSIVCVLVVVLKCCELKDFVPCVMQLNAQKVDFKINPLDVILSLSSEAKLMHTCRTYARVFPCFDQKISHCGTPDQKAQLERGKRLHSYLCAPFSLPRQKLLTRNSQCIQKILKEPETGKCDRRGTLYEEKLASCRDFCKNRKDCGNKIEASENATCRFTKIEKTCSEEAAEFFGQLQRVLTNREYPMQCQYDLRPVFHELKKGILQETFVTTLPPNVRRTEPAKPKFLPNPYTGRTTRTTFNDNQWNSKAEQVISAPPLQFMFNLPKEQTSTQPFKVEINWMDDIATTTPMTTTMKVASSPWYVRTVATSTETSPFKSVNPIIDHLKASPSLNLTEIGNHANNYFSAALSAISETKNQMEQNDPWRTIIDAVAPTIIKVSPEFIPRIRQEIDRIQPGQ